MAVLNTRMGFSPDLCFHLVSVPSTGGCTGTLRGKGSINPAFSRSVNLPAAGAPACHHLVQRGLAPETVAPCWCNLSTFSAKDLNIPMDPQQYPLISTRSLAIHKQAPNGYPLHYTFQLYSGCVRSKPWNLTGYEGTTHFPSPCRNHMGTNGHCMPCGTSLM